MNRHAIRIYKTSIIISFIASCIVVSAWMPIKSQAAGVPLAKGQKLPNAELVGKGQQIVRLDDLKGRVKILSMVPQLNTPVCDEQTHRFSENNGGLDAELEIVTISTNTADDQARFAEKADIHNITFLSDSPHHDFGKKTGLLHPMHDILYRTVIVADSENVIRYVEHVPMGQLPNFDQAFESALKTLELHTH